MKDCPELALELVIRQEMAPITDFREPVQVIVQWAIPAVLETLVFLEQTRKVTERFLMQVPWGIQEQT